MPGRWPGRRPSSRCGGALDGKRILSEAGCRRALESQISGVDLVLNNPINFGMGPGLANEHAPASEHVLLGRLGRLPILVDQDRRITVSFVMNRMVSTLMGDPRTPASWPRRKQVSRSTAARSPPGLGRLSGQLSRGGSDQSRRGRAPVVRLCTRRAPLASTWSIGVRRGREGAGQVPVAQVQGEGQKTLSRTPAPEEGRKGRGIQIPSSTSTGRVACGHPRSHTTSASSVRQPGASAAATSTARAGHRQSSRASSRAHPAPDVRGRRRLFRVERLPVPAGDSGSADASCPGAGRPGHAVCRDRPRHNVERFLQRRRTRRRHLAEPDHIRGCRA